MHLITQLFNVHENTSSPPPNLKPWIRPWLGVSILSLSTMCLLDFGTVQTVWYYLLSFHSMPTLHFELVRFYN